MNISGTLGYSEMTIGSKQVQAPYRVDAREIIDEHVVLLIGCQSLDYHEDSDFDLPEPGRNVVAFDSSADLVWTISDAPPKADSADLNYYVDLLTITGAIYARDVEKRLYEIDPASGRIVRRVDDTTLPIANKDVSIGGWVVKVVEFDDYVVVRCGGSDSPSLYGFDTQGNELWKTDERRGMIYWDGSVLIEKRTLGPRAGDRFFYRLDPDTGERLAKIEVEHTGSGWKYVEDISEDV